MKKIVLGTVQMGLKYGINNLTGKPGKENCFNILDYAYNNEINCLDTAEDYGESETIIGDYIKKTNKRFHICTKLSSTFDYEKSNLYQRVNDKVSISIERLGQEQLYLYYLHSFKHCKNIQLLQVLSRLKELDYIKNIGISIYDPQELKYIINNCSDIIDVVQIPFNILDCARWLDHDLLQIANDKKLKIFSRSIFLQGLLFKSPNDIFINKINANEYIDYLIRIAKDMNTSVINLAYNFVNSISHIDSIIFGCETKEQLVHNVNMINSATSLRKADINDIISYCTDISSDIIDPRKW